MTRLSGPAERVLDAYLEKVRRTVITQAELNSTSSTISASDVITSIGNNDLPPQDFGRAAFTALSVANLRTRRRRRGMQTIGILYVGTGALVAVVGILSTYGYILPEFRTAVPLSLLGALTALVGASIAFTISVTNHRQHGAQSKKNQLFEFIESWAMFEQALGFGAGKSLSRTLAQAKAEKWLTENDVTQARQILQTRNLVVHDGVMPSADSLAADTLRLQQLTRKLEEPYENLRGETTFTKL